MASAKRRKSKGNKTVNSQKNASTDVLEVRWTSKMSTATGKLLDFEPSGKLHRDRSESDKRKVLTGRQYIVTGTTDLEVLRRGQYRIFDPDFCFDILTLDGPDELTRYLLAFTPLHVPSLRRTTSLRHPGSRYHLPQPGLFAVYQLVVSASV